METFLVQVWVPADATSSDAEVRGLVRHIASGTEAPFRGEEVLGLLRRVSARGLLNPQAASPEGNPKSTRMAPEGRAGH